jgi:hypothetical protein
VSGQCGRDCAATRCPLHPGLHWPVADAIVAARLLPPAARVIKYDQGGTIVGNPLFEERPQGTGRRKAAASTSERQRCVPTRFALCSPGRAGSLGDSLCIPSAKPRSLGRGFGGAPVSKGGPRQLASPQ